MKRYLHVILFMILALSFVGVDAKGNTIYLKECEYTDEYKEWLKLSDEEKKDTIMPTICKNNNVNKFVAVGNASSVLSGASPNDSKFNLKDQGLVTNVKNQYPTGSCWAFATSSSIESNLLINGYGTYDLSEAHMELSTQTTVSYNRLTFNRTINLGGNYLQAAAYLRNNWGAVLESNLPFDELANMYDVDGNIIQSNVVDESKVLNNTAKVDVNSVTMFGNSGTCSNSTIKEIKEYLITNGALASTMYFGNNSSYNVYQYYDGKEFSGIPAEQPSNHAITIVGWDDSISKDKFSNTGTPTRDGAFVIKNSYGTQDEMSLSELKVAAYDDPEIKEIFNEMGIYSPEDINDEYIVILLGIDEGQYAIDGDKLTLKVGNEGYQYVSYDDVRICNNLTGFFDVDTDVEKYVYGYDDLGYAGEISFLSSNVGYFASIFDKQSSGNEKLEELNIYFPKVGQEYEVYFANGETKSIEDAKLVAMGKSKFIGYNTIQLDEQIITNKKYSIIIKVSDNELLRFGVSAKVSDITPWYDTFEYTEKVQFTSVDGINYAPTEMDGEGFSLLIKVYTNDTNEAPKEDNTLVEDEKTNDDSKIEILPSDMDNKNENENIGEIPNDESNEENPSTGDIVSSLLIITFVIIGVGFISHRKLQSAKSN